MKRRHRNISAPARLGAAKQLSILLVGLAVILASATRANAGGVVTFCSKPYLEAAMAGGGMVTFACSGVISFTTPITVTNDTMLDATGRSVVLSGANLSRVFNVSAGARLTLLNLTISNSRNAGYREQPSPGFTITHPGFGGAIANTGIVCAVNCIFTNNSAQGINGEAITFLFPPSWGAGGAIYSVGEIFATNCVFVRNRAQGGSAALASYGAGAAGAALYSVGNATLDSCSFSRNTVTAGNGASGTPVQYWNGLPGGGGDGGAIFSAGNLTIQACAFESNQVTAGNGGNGTNGATGLAGSGGGGGHASGGGLYHDSGNLVLSACSFSGNTITGGYGGFGAEDLTSISQAGYGGNGGYARGTAIFLNTGIAFLTNNTVALNVGKSGRGGNGGDGQDCNPVVSKHPGGAGGPGGHAGVALGQGLSIASAQAVSVNNTFVTNRGIGETGGLGGAAGIGCFPYPNGSPGANGSNYIVAGDNIGVFTGSILLFNTIMADSPSNRNCSGTILDGGHNISSDTSCGLTEPTSFNNTDPRLAPLGHYGGPTRCMPLLTGSPAINIGNNALCPPADQRGTKRPQEHNCDIGAFEAVGNPFQVTSVQYGPTGFLHLHGTGPSGAVFQVEMSAVLPPNWQRATGYWQVTPMSEFDVILSNSPYSRQRFYRTVVW